jgi:squalene-associated FAD-dependent desaturase
LKPHRGWQVAVIGAGWAGLAAALRLSDRGALVHLLEMAPQPGGRARSLAPDGEPDEGWLDNGQHILIGAYVQTLALMRHVGIELDSVLRRSALNLRFADGSGLALPPGAPIPAFLRGVWAASDWSVAERLALLRAAASWGLRGFRCSPGLSVAQLCGGLPLRVREGLIEPLCVAALNTPASQASASVFLRVLRDALFSGPGSADLLLPAAPLSALMPTAACQRLAEQGAQVHLRQRVTGLHPPTGNPGGWRLDAVPGHLFDAVVLATSAAEAARLTQAIAPAWAAQAQSLRYEPIVTVYAHSPQARLAQPMLALRATDQAPAQFVFDQGQLGGAAGRLAFVISGAAVWVQRGTAETEAAVVAQAAHALRITIHPLRTLVEKRATFRCTPALQRPPMVIVPGLLAAGDYVQGPYPATLEGAVRAGLAAADSALAMR